MISWMSIGNRANRRSVSDSAIYHSLRKRSESVAVITCPNSRFYGHLPKTQIDLE